MNDEDRLLSRRETMTLMSISDSTERRMRQRGDMPSHVLIGTKILYRLSTVKQWVRDHEVTGS